MQSIKIVLTTIIISTNSFGILGVGDIVFDPTQTAKAVLEYEEK